MKVDGFDSPKGFLYKFWVLGFREDESYVEQKAFCYPRYYSAHDG